MRIIAYLYADPAFEEIPELEIWGWEVDRVYRDLGDRFQLQQLQQDCQNIPPNYLLLRRLEELGDTLDVVVGILQQLESVGIKIIATEQNYRTPTSDDDPQSRYRLSLILAEIESDRRSRCIRQGHARNRLRAAPPPGRAPYGYRRGKDRYILDRSTAPVVKDFFDRYLLYNSLRESVRYLEKKYGKKISVTTGRRWLTNPIYRGDIRYHNGHIIVNTHPAIVSREEAAQVDRLLRRNSRLPSRTASAPRSLAGLTICHECMANYTITRVKPRNNVKEYLYLRPVHCSRSNRCKGVSYTEVLTKTIEQICQQLPLAIANFNRAEEFNPKQEIAAEIAQKEAILQHIPDLQIQGILDEDTANLRSYKLRAELARLQQNLAQLPPDNLQPIAQEISFPQFWQDLSESERRFYFREFIKQILIIRDRDGSWHLKIVFIFDS
ncbi:MAG: recombinase family protein [Cyanobacteria bacterium SBLK]|nr:recombinase family protein [Cyanobacteria bacterium SBLK]